MRPIPFALALMLLAAPSAPPAAHAANGNAPRLCTSAIADIDAAAAATLAQGSPGMIVEVARGEEVLFSGRYGLANLEYAAPVRTDTVFDYASITKQFTAATVLSLAEDGMLGLDDRLGEYVSEIPAARDVTLYQLLVQSSGIPDYAEDPDIAERKGRRHTLEDMLAWIAGRTDRLEFEPGTKWAYSNSNYALLGLVIERVTEKPLEDVMQDRLFARAGITQIAFDDPADVVPHRASGYRKDRAAPSGFRNADWIHPTIPGPAGGLRGTARDLIRWNAALFGGRVLPTSALARLTEAGRLNDGRTTKLGMPEAWQKGLDSDYAMGLFRKVSRGGSRIGHGGNVDGFSTWAAHYPGSGITIVQMINSESADLRTDEVEAAVFRSPGKPCFE